MDSEVFAVGSIPISFKNPTNVQNKRVGNTFCIRMSTHLCRCRDVVSFSCCAHVSIVLVMAGSGGGKHDVL